ncbi:MAG: hypothetical protein ACRDWT_14085 [Jatrophihabitantaceae bacterium]
MGGLAELVDEDAFPCVSGSLVDSAGGDFADEEFLFGLQSVLDGVATLIARRTRRR